MALSSLCEGRFEEIKEISGTLYGRVVLAWDKLEQRQCAIKVHRRDLVRRMVSSRGDRVKDDVAIEIAVMRSVRESPHPNLLPSYELPEGMEDEKNIYTMMPYAGYGDLYTHVSEVGAVPERLACSYFIQLLGALEHLHGFGWCHRDVSLENVLLMDEQRTRLVLCDYGLALRLPDFGAPQHALAGKLMYTAPELYQRQWNFKALKRDVLVSRAISADLFALGVVLFVLLVGHPPFNSADPIGDAFYRLIVAGPESIGRLVDGWDCRALSPEALDILHQILSPDPNTRLTATRARQHAWVRRYTQNVPERLAHSLAPASAPSWQGSAGGASTAHKGRSSSTDGDQLPPPSSPPSPPLHPCTSEDAPQRLK